MCNLPWLGLDLNYRYDHVKYLPSYDEKIPVPNGLIAGYLRNFAKTTMFMVIKIRRLTDMKIAPTPHLVINKILKTICPVITQTDYKHHSYNLGLNLDPTDWLRVQLKYANGFRAPTSDEIYMTFKTSTIFHSA